MSLTIKLFQFSKKLNSTAVPTGTTPSVNYADAYILDQTDIVNPSIRFMYVPGSTNPTSYNYAQISEFSRYYFIDSWRWTNDGWIADMTVDALASFKSAIGSSTQYILRSSYSYDGDIIDTFYPTATDVTFDKIEPSYPWLNAVDAGCYIVGVVSPDPQFGAISYYVLTSSSLAVLCDYLTDQTKTITAANGFDLTDASLSLQNSVVDAFQYIKSCIYVPLSYASITGDTNFSSLKIWCFNIPSCPGKTLSQQHPQYTSTRQITLPKHPQTASRGNWINTSPWTNAELSFPPFGTIQLDTSITATHPVIDMDYRTDLITGLTTLWVYAKETISSTSRVLIGTREGQIGIPIQLAQVTRDYVGAATSALGGLIGGIGSIVGGVMTGNFGGVASGVSSIFGGVGNAITSMIPHSQTQGSSGAWYQLIAPCACYITFYPCVSDDNNRFGRPISAPGTISSYPGYLLCQNVTLPISGALAREIEIMKDYMEAGFYYE